MAAPSETTRLIKYCILQISEVPSLACDLLIFAYFIRHWRREILTAPQNHVILCLLIVSFIQKITDVPFLLHYYRTGDALVHNDTFCVIWNWLDYSFIMGNLHLLTWCCMERHLFIFHSQAMKKRHYLILGHYIPLTICLIYLPLFYACVMFLQTLCMHVWDYSLPLCGVPCYLYLSLLVTTDWLFHCAAPTLLILLISTCLFVRIIWQKIKRQHRIQWGRQRHLIIQLTLISTLFLVLVSPMVIVGVIQIVWASDFLADIQYNWFTLLAYFPNQFLPFIMIGQLSGVRLELRKWISCVKRSNNGQRQVHPTRGTTIMRP